MNVERVTTPVSCRCHTPQSPKAAAALLARFQALDAENKQLGLRNKELEALTTALLEKNQQQETSYKECLAENNELRAQLGRAAKPIENGCISISRNPSHREGMQCNGSNHSLTFDSFCEELVDLGIEISKDDRQLALEDLYVHVREGEIQISNVGGNITQQSKVVRVYVLAKIAGDDERCLIHHDRFNLKSGSQQTLMVPLEVRMRCKETWQEAARRGLQTMIGLSREWQDQYIQFDESSHFSSEEQGTPNDASGNFLRLLTSVEVHEIHAEVKVPSFAAVSGVTTEFDRIGLPSGRDFVFCDQNQTMVHVWCWRSREYERNGRMKFFEKYLSSHGVDVSQFGTGQNKTLFQFYHEVQEKKQSYLNEVFDSPDSSSPGLQRVVQILKIKLIAEVHKRKRVLMETEQYGSTGRKRASGQLIIKKLAEGEDWKEAVPSAIQARVNVSPAVQAECFSIDEEKTVYVEEVVRSKGFAGIVTCYKITTVTMYVTDPHAEELEAIGLPRGNDFVSREESHDAPSGGMKLHVWTWAPALEEEDGPGGQFRGTALEMLNRDLGDVESLLAQTVCDPLISQVGLDKPLKQSLQKLKQVAEGLADIDKTITSVDLSDVMGQDGGSPSRRRASWNAMSGLKSFIEANFVRQQAPEAKAEVRLHSKESAQPDSFFWNVESSLPGAKALLEGRDTWEFDFFKLYDELGLTMLSTYAEVIVAPHCVSALRCKGENAKQFVQEAASQYLDNPYHGQIHAAQVCHLSRWLTKALRIMEQQSGIERAAFTIAGFCHDIKHFGRNNIFCVKTEHPLAMLYSNSRVLEQFHSATCLELLESKLLLQALPREDRALCRSHIIEYILATDMAEHFETISKFRVRRDAHDFSIETETDRRFVARLCLKAGDLGHACLPWELHVEWAFRVTQEFYAQGDDEIRIGVPVSALCNRKEIPGLGKSQKGFLDFVVLPLFQVLGEFQQNGLEALPKAAEEANTDISPMSSQTTKSKRRRSSIPLIGMFHVETCNIAHLQANGSKWQTDDQAVREFQSRFGPPASPKSR